MESSIAEHDIDLYASNMAGIPIFARSGALDDNVPPLHSRKLVRLVNEWNRDPKSISYSEIPNQGHWYRDIMNDSMIQNFIVKSIYIMN